MADPDDNDPARRMVRIDRAAFNRGFTDALTLRVLWDVFRDVFSLPKKRNRGAMEALKRERERLKRLRSGE